MDAQIAAAEAYESLHVPALFHVWAEPVLDAAGVAAGDRVLDVACGTGILARVAARRVGPTGSVAGVDANPGMLVVAGRLAPNVEWREGPAESLPFADDSFDRVVSQFGLMFFSDRAAAVREMVRVLAPGGSFAVAVWDALENSAAYSTEVALLDRVGGREAGDALRAPFVLGDPAALEALFRVQGVDGLEITTTSRPARFPSIRRMVEADLRGWLPVMGVELSERTIDMILREAETEMAGFLEGDGGVAFEESGHIVVGTKSA